MQLFKTLFVISLFLIGFQEPLSADDYVHSDSDSIEKRRPGMGRGGRGRRGGMRSGRGGMRRGGYRGGMGRGGYRRGMGRGGYRRGMGRGGYRRGMGRGYRGPRYGRGYRGPRRGYSRGYRHRPYRRYRNHHSRWYYPYYYYNNIPYQYVWWNYWVRYPYDYQDGYVWHNGYPYFAYNGYIGRYSNRDICNYELVDSQTRATVEAYHGQTCTIGYDTCAQQRDELNHQANDNRYFCSERYSRRNGPIYNLD